LEGFFAEAGEAHGSGSLKNITVVGKITKSGIVPDLSNDFIIYHEKGFLQPF
jgi:hypothetical protein